MADFTATFVDHSERIPMVQYTVEQAWWCGTENADFVSHELLGVVQTPGFGILYPKR